MNIPTTISTEAAVCKIELKEVILGVVNESEFNLFWIFL